MGDHSGGVLELENFRAAGFNLDCAFQRITALWPGELLCLGRRIAECGKDFICAMIEATVDGKRSGGG
jgi:hypothetical protein